MGNVETLSFGEAWSMADAARYLLQKEGKRAAVCIVNRDGAILVEFALDGIRPISAHITRLKAIQCVRTGQRTRWIRDGVQSKTCTLGLFNVSPEEYVPWAGGVPVYSRDGVMLGGLAVGEMPEDDDEACAIRVVEAAGFRSDRE